MSIIITNWGLQLNGVITQDFHRPNNIPPAIARPPGSPWIVVGSVTQQRRRRKRKQKRGCRAGLLARLRKQAHKPPLRAYFSPTPGPWSTKWTRWNYSWRKNNCLRDCCVLVIAETWLHPAIPDAAVQLAGRTTHRQDRSKDSGKTRGGGLCAYVHNFGLSSRIIHSYCSPNIEALSVMCRPFYLPRELTVVIVTAVYIPPGLMLAQH